MFKIYVKLYYSTATVCSVYCWELGEALAEGYGVAIFIKNSLAE